MWTFLCIMSIPFVLYVSARIVTRGVLRSLREERQKYG